MFETAFHDQANNDLSKYSTGDYISPDRDYHDLARLSKRAQSQTRFAAVYARVQTWHAAPPGTTRVVSEDVDLDGEDEYLLFNSNLFFLCERIGGRVTGAWLRRPGNLFQMAGNFISYDDDETEMEEVANQLAENATGAHRTSLLRDQFAETSPGNGTAEYVNQLYTVSPMADGWQMVSADGKIQKQITLGSTDQTAEVSYALMGISRLYVRHGFSPHLEDLLLHGQRSLLPLRASASELVLSNQAGQVSARIGLGINVQHNPDATDDDNNELTTLPMRNQAQTEQVELYGSGNFDFTIGFSQPRTHVILPPPDNDEDGIPDAEDSDDDNDGIPDTWELAYALDPFDATDAEEDGDGDNFSNLEEYQSDTDPGDINEFLIITDLEIAGNQISFPAKAQSRVHPAVDHRPGRRYRSLDGHPRPHRSAR